VLLERRDPRALLLTPLELAGDQQYRIGRRLRGESRERLLPHDIRCRREPHLDEAPRREQRQVGRLHEQRIPVEAALREVHLAIRVVPPAGGLTHRIAGLGDEQRLGPGDQVGTSQPALEARRQCVR